MGKGILLTGPGTHSHLLAQALQQTGRLHAYISYYPDWEMVFSDGRRKKIAYYRHIVRLMWAVWRCIPYWGQYENPRTWHFALYDWLSKRHLSSPIQFLWAWSGMSLYCMRSAKAHSMKVFLEFPASHPVFWNNLAHGVYGELKLDKGKFGIQSSSLVERQVAELILADKVIVLSSFVRKQMEHYGVPTEKVVQMPLGVEADTFTPVPLINASPFRVLYVGRIDPLKGVHILLEAWKQLALPNAELWLIGHVLPEMKSILARYEGSFRYMGALAREKLPELYRQASVFVFPTLMDSFGMVLLEAMASGLPVIATAHSAAPDLLDEGVIPAGDVEALKAAMLNLYERRGELADIGRQNRQRVEASYTITHYIERVRHLLENHGL